MASLEVPGARIGYDLAGTGSGLLFLHGVGSVRAVWEPQMAAFAGRHTCVAMDFRGHGQSACVAATISIERFAADVAGLIETVLSPPVHVCGLSLGGIVGLELWRRRPELVRSLVLAGSWARHPAAAAGLLARLLAIDTTPLARLAAERIPAVLAPGTEPGLVSREVAVMAAKDVPCFRRSNEVLWATDLRAVAASVRVPALVLVGEHDVITPPELSQELAALIPGARLVTIPGAGHLVSADHPDQFNSALDAFLKGFPE